MKRVSRGVWALDILWFLAWGLASSLWCLTASSQLSATFDEPFYISKGLEFWRTGSHRGFMQKGTMPLPPDLDTLSIYLWERWDGIQFDPASDLDRLLAWARGGTLIFWWLLLAYGWRAGRHLAGPWGGRLAVAMLACEPSLLAHASLATTDIAASACLLAMVYHFRTGREAGWRRRVALPALWFAALVLSKASGLVFGSVCLLVVELEHLVRGGRFSRTNRALEKWTWLRYGLDRLRPFRRDVIQIVALGLALVFLYCGSDWRTAPSFVRWAHTLPDGPVGRIMVWLADHLRIFSNAGEGLVWQIRHNVRGQGTYLLGHAYRRAIWYYFPALLTIKLCAPLLILPVVLALIRPRALANWACLAAAALMMLSPTFRVQIGIRLVLPVVLLAIVGLAAAAIETCRNTAPRWRGRMLAAGVAGGVVWTAWSAMVVWPHGLSYVNELWGGTEHGYTLVSDSNYDWGQGLKELARWQRAYGRGPLNVWYFGKDPAVNRLPLREVPLHALPINGPEDVTAQVQGHYLAVSTTLLYGTILTTAHQRAQTFLLARQPVARTMTFMIYDFTGDRDGGRTGSSSDPLGTVPIPAYQDTRASCLLCRAETVSECLT